MYVQLYGIQLQAWNQLPRPRGLSMTSPCTHLKCASIREENSSRGSERQTRAWGVREFNVGNGPQCSSAKSKMHVIGLVSYHRRECRKRTHTIGRGIFCRSDRARRFCQGNACEWCKYEHELIRMEYIKQNICRIGREEEPNPETSTFEELLPGRAGIDGEGERTSW